MAAAAATTAVAVAITIIAAAAADAFSGASLKPHFCQRSMQARTRRYISSFFSSISRSMPFSAHGMLTQPK